MKFKRTLYLGLDPSRFSHEGELIHCPVIQTVPFPFRGELEKIFRRLEEFTHVLFTSRTAIPIYKKYALEAGCAEILEKKIYLCIGKATALQLKETGINFQCLHIAQEETAEGIISLLHHIDFKHCHLFFPRSAQGRSLIPHYLNQRGILSTVLDIYKTKPTTFSLPDLNSCDAIIFTSPSTVQAFFGRAPFKPPLEKCIAIGPITEKILKEYYED